MANDMMTKVTIVGDASSLTKATKKAGSDLKGLSSGAKKIGSSLKGAIGAFGIALSFTAIKNELERATKAAIDDAKSQALLEKQLQNTVKATKEQSAAVEDAITKMSLLAAVPDDEIRPAFATLLRGTKSVGKATKLTSLALDVAAGTGKDVTSVAKALSKAYAGNTGSLSKLGINVKKGSNWMKELKKQFGGMAEVAARKDPLKRLQVTAGELQEKVGQGLVPGLNKLADWFNANYDNIAKFFTDAWNSEAMNMLRDAMKNVWNNVLKPFIDWLGKPEVKKGFDDLWKSVGNIVNSLTDFATGDFAKKFGEIASPTILRSLELLAGLLNGIADTIDRLNGKPAAYTSANRAAGVAMNPFRSSLTGTSTGNILDKTYGNFSSVGAPTVVNVTINANKLDPKAVVDEINKWSKRYSTGRLKFGN